MEGPWVGLVCWMMRAPSTQPTVSVCIPHTGGPPFREAVDSVLAQTFADFELLIVDDDSPDDTSAIASSYRDPRVRCLRNRQNLGPQGNWNRCLTEATGRYFKLLPQDDVLARDCLQREVEVLEAGRHIRSRSCSAPARSSTRAPGRCWFDEHWPDGSPPDGQHPIPEVPPRRDQRHRRARRCAVCRELANTVGPFDATFPYVVDLDYWFRLLAHGDGYYVAETLVSFRVSPGAWMSHRGQSGGRIPGPRREDRERWSTSVPGCWISRSAGAGAAEQRPAPVPLPLSLRERMTPATTKAASDRDYAARQLCRRRNPLRRAIKRFYLNNMLREVHGASASTSASAPGNCWSGSPPVHSGSK